MTPTRTKRRVAKFVVGLWAAGAVVAIPGAASASHQCDAIEITYWCPWNWTYGSVCVGDPHGVGHACISGNE